VANITAEEVVCGINTLLGVFKDWVQTLAFDNGKGFAKHEEVVNALECEICFAESCHSWERGRNENANGLLRQYFPKTMGLLDVTTQQGIRCCTQT
jgi:IS30 family transposase